MTKSLPPTLPPEFANIKTLDELLDKNGPLKTMFKSIIEQMLEVELTDHLGYKRHNSSGNNSGNSRNGKSQKTLRTSYGETEIQIPRDRNGGFEPQAVRKYQTSSNEIEDKIVTLYARGITTRDIEQTLKELYGIDVSHTFVSEVTDKILPLVTTWQARPLSSIYPIIYLDAIHYNVREDGKIVKKAAYLALGIDVDGNKDLLGIWIGESESSKFWLGVLNDLKSRGVNDICIVCTDGLTGFEEALQTAFPKAIQQLCIVHQIRNSLRYIASKDTRAFLADLKKVYQATTREAAEMELANLETVWGKHYPLVLKSWKNNWHRLSAYFDYPFIIRKLIYTTNPIEGFNRGLRKFTKNRSIFPNDIALRKMLYLAAKNITEKWTKPIANWGQIISELSICFPDRIKLDI